MSAVAIVGSRAATTYGEHVTSELAYGLAGDGRAVVSGGAFGIDAAAHRGALAGRGDAVPTVAFMAGGVDRLYPRGNLDLLEAICSDGLVISETAPGMSAMRHRFLQRNRLIAAASLATVVVEAAWRSGALNTAHRASELGRAVGAVPGSVFSAASAGCHRLLREGAATCVTGVDEILEMVTELDAGAATAAFDVPLRSGDGLDGADLLVFDALPLRGGAGADALAARAGLTPIETMSALARLELSGHTERAARGWIKHRPPARD